MLHAAADQAIAEAMDAQVETQQADAEDRDDGAAGVSAPAGQLHVNCTAGAVGGCGSEGAADAQRRELRFRRGAGDGNRTRTISLGSLWRYSLATW
jgi:hypothetical protein